VGATRRQRTLLREDQGVGGGARWELGLQGLVKGCWGVLRWRQVQQP